MKIVTIVGVGALGSHVVLLLRNEEVTFRIIDHDRVEQKNTLSQFHAVSRVGALKVEALKATMQFLFKRSDIVSYGHKLTELNVASLLDRSSLVVDCVDNAATRKLIQYYVRKNKIPTLHGALSANGEYGRACWDDKFVIDSEANAGAATCADGEHLPFITTIASYVARCVQEFLHHNRQVGYEVSLAGIIKT